MLIYLFIEHYPNPYKPWIDTQVVQLLRAGHEVRIFAEGRFTSTIHDEVREWDLESKTSYYPATLKYLRRDGWRAAASLGAQLSTQLYRAKVAAQGSASPKHKLLAASRALLLPQQPPDVCYIHNLVTASRLTLLRRLYPSSRVCLYFHGGEVGGQPKVTGESEVFAAVDAVVTSTRFAAGQAVERGCPPGKIAIVPLGFHLPSYPLRSDRSYRPQGAVRFVSVGRMSPEKGFLHALEAVKRLVQQGQRNFTYKLVGKGIQFADLRRFVRDQGLDPFVDFLGEKTRKEVAHELAQSDVFILPSIVTDLWAETQATVVQEALLMGCLTITTLAGGVPESNADAMRQFAVPPADADALATQMCEVLRLGPGEMARLGSAGRAFAERTYDIGPLMDRIMAHAQNRLAADDPTRFVRASANA